MSFNKEFTPQSGRVLNPIGERRRTPCKRVGLNNKQIKLFVALLSPAFFLAADGSEPAIAVRVSRLVIQVALIVVLTRMVRNLNKGRGIPLVIGDLLAGVLIGPYALGGFHINGVFDGLFPRLDGPISVSPELYTCAVLGSGVLLFAMGLETDLKMFIRYSVAGSIIGIGGALVSFITGAFTASLFLHMPITALPCLFMGLLASVSSVGISSHVLMKQKKIDSTEGISAFAAAGTDNIFGLVMLVVIMGIAGGGTESVLLKIALWLVFGILALRLAFSKKLGEALNTVRSVGDLSLLALGAAFLVGGVFDTFGLPLVSGAYIIGLSLSRTSLASIIQDRIRGIYDFFIPIFFAVMGMFIDLSVFFSIPVLLFALGLTILLALAKFVGCGLPALLIGFNTRGALRIGALMSSHGELSIIIASLAFVAGAFDTRLFGAVMLMCLISSCGAFLFSSFILKFPGPGTKKQVKSDELVHATWEFYSDEIANLVIDMLLMNLKEDGFFTQRINIDEGITQARKDTVALSIIGKGSAVNIETYKGDAAFVRNEVHKVVLDIRAAVQKIALSSDHLASQKKESASELLSLIKWENIVLDLKAETKEAVLAELVDILATRGKLYNRDEVLHAVLARENIMSTGIQYGIAMPHAKTDGVSDLHVVIGIKKTGIEFNSLDGKKARLFILVVSPKKRDSQHVPFLAAITSILKDATVRERVINAATNEEAYALLQGR
ncbi:MAG: cation:proton antiporter [Treponema sp.]|jgi:Kef-type K+ transport system membrane component KefB/mannitol/fructose-specific phosphotransferase system IIA component (Ntr-type)|nr:cation:proton antiporter [Treponema sp.]